MRRYLTGSGSKFVFKSAGPFVLPYIDQMWSIAMREPWPSEVALQLRRVVRGELSRLYRPNHMWPTVNPSGSEGQPEGNQPGRIVSRPLLLPDTHRQGSRDGPLGAPLR
jgi:hypothetical protein